MAAAMGSALWLVPAPAVAQGPTLPPLCVGDPSVAGGPFVRLLVNSVCYDLSALVRPIEEGKIWELPPTGDLALEIATVQFMSPVVFNADPFITFGVSTTNLVPGPVTYAFLFGTPIVPDFYTSAGSSGGLSLTAGEGVATVDNSAIYPTYISGYGTNGGVPTNLGVDLGTDPCVATGLPTTTCNQGTAVNAFAPTFYDNLEALLTYTQTDLRSVASWSGRVELLATTTVIPEPATLGLVFTGLLVVGGVGAARRRRR